MEHTRLQHVGVACRHVQDTLKFYQKVFGLEIAHVWGRKGKVYLLHMGDNSYLELNEEEDPDIPIIEGPWSHICLKTNDIDATFHHALEAGATVGHAPYLCATDLSEPRAPECYIAALTGPEGEGLGLIQEEGVEKDPTILHHIGIHTQDIDGYAAFYEKTLGLKVGRIWKGDYPSRMIALGGNSWIEVNTGNANHAHGRGHFSHIAIKSGDVPGDYAKAMAAVGAPMIHEPMLCDVIEAQPRPVQWYSAGFKGPENEDVSLTDDLAPGVWETRPVFD